MTSFRHTCGVVLQYLYLQWCHSTGKTGGIPYREITGNVKIGRISGTFTIICCSDILNSSFSIYNDILQGITFIKVVTEGMLDFAIGEDQGRLIFMNMTLLINSFFRLTFKVPNQSCMVCKH